MQKPVLLVYAFLFPLLSCLLLLVLFLRSPTSRGKTSPVRVKLREDLGNVGGGAVLYLIDKGSDIGASGGRVQLVDPGHDFRENLRCMRHHQDAVEARDGHDAHTSRFVSGREDLSQVLSHIDCLVIADGHQVYGIDLKVLRVQKPNDLQRLPNVGTIIGNDQDVGRLKVHHLGPVRNEGLDHRDHFH